MKGSFDRGPDDRPSFGTNMTSAGERPLPLVRHPGIACDAVRAIDVRAGRVATGELGLVFRLEGDLSRLRIPSPRTPRLGADLWRHTCFEAFVASEAAAGYHELNFAPSGEWAVYAFRGYRDGGPLREENLAPAISVRVSGQQLELDVRFPIHRLSPEYGTTPLRVGLAAVIETSDGSCSYWALRHPDGEPDFHHDRSFVLRL